MRSWLTHITAAVGKSPDQSSIKRLPTDNIVWLSRRRGFRLGVTYLSEGYPQRKWFMAGLPLRLVASSAHGLNARVVELNVMLVKTWSWGCTTAADHHGSAVAEAVSRLGRIATILDSSTQLATDCCGIKRANPFSSGRTPGICPWQNERCALSVSQAPRAYAISPANTEWTDEYHRTSHYFRAFVSVQVN